MFPVLLFVYYRLSKTEEGEMLKIFGDEYKKYMQRTLCSSRSSRQDSIGLQANSSPVSHLVDVNEKGEITIHPDCSTSYPGIFAAGDVTNAFGKRIIIACGEGAKAVMAARQHVLDIRRRREVTAEY